MTTRREQDFQKFMERLVKLEPINFCTLGKLWNIPMKDNGGHRDAELVVDEMCEIFVKMDRKNRADWLKVLDVTIKRQQGGKHGANSEHKEK